MNRFTLPKLTKFEWALWLGSVSVVLGASLLFQSDDPVNLTASLVGVTGAILMSKGHVLGQVLSLIFATSYGVISIFFRYYGEVFTSLCMTAPIALVSLINWIRHPYQGSNEVEISRLTLRQKGAMAVLAVAVTVLSWFVLDWLNTANLFLSTISVTASFVAAYLSACRSAYYALAYACNDLTLLGLWISAALTDVSCVPMVACMSVFFFNDIYGYVSWKARRQRQGG